MEGPLSTYLDKHLEDVGIYSCIVGLLGRPGYIVINSSNIQSISPLKQRAICLRYFGTGIGCDILNDIYNGHPTIAEYVVNGITCYLLLPCAPFAGSYQLYRYEYDISLMERGTIGTSGT